MQLTYRGSILLDIATNLENDLNQGVELRISLALNLALENFTNKFELVIEKCGTPFINEKIDLKVVLKFSEPSPTRNIK